jgi:hypothetical protein
MLLTIIDYTLPVLLVLFFYNIPSLIAVARLHNNGRRIVAFNIVLGWTVIGWTWALALSLQDPDASYE